MDEPLGLAVDATGRIFIAEYGNSRVRMIDANGVIRTIAGTGDFVSSAESGPATAVAFVSNAYRGRHGRQYLCGG
ncbi:MAG: hypothetical protein WDO18_10645 [Acidobacteriota bacterium]